MTDLELIIEWFEDMARTMRRDAGELSFEQLYWQPYPEGNSIGTTVFHVARWLDLVKVRALENRSAADEIWHTRGWAEKTGYDPRGIGYMGFGAITGYTWEEIEAVPKLTPAELVTYFDQVSKALFDHLKEMPPQALHQPAAGFESNRTNYQWLRPILRGGLEHLGEIQAFIAMMKKRNKT